MRIIPVLAAFALNYLLLTQHVFAQNPIPNPDFEDWSGGEPTGWNTINQSVFGTSFVCVTRDLSNPQHGTSCAKIETVTHNIFLVGPVTMPGILSLGEITLDVINQTGTVSGGVPITTQPNQLRGWFRYLPSNGDSCILGIGLSRWNGVGRDTLALAYKVIGGQTPDWTEFSVPIEYLIWTMPDTMNIMFFSSNLLNGSPVSGSELWIDNLMLEYGPVAVQNAGMNEAPSIRYSTDGFPIITLNNGAVTSEISVFNLNGILVKNFPTSPGLREIILNTSDLASGIYLARFKNKTGSPVSLKFVRY